MIAAAKPDQGADQAVESRADSAGDALQQVVLTGDRPVLPLDHFSTEELNKNNRRVRQEDGNALEVVRWLQCRAMAASRSPFWS